MLTHLFKSSIEWTLYLTRKDDDLLDDPSSLFLEELLNDVNTDGTGPNDGEFCVSRHELRLFAVCVNSEHRRPLFIDLTLTSGAQSEDDK